MPSQKDNAAFMHVVTTAHTVWGWGMRGSGGEGAEGGGYASCAQGVGTIQNSEVPESPRGCPPAHMVCDWTRVYLQYARLYVWMWWWWW